MVGTSGSKEIDLRGFYHPPYYTRQWPDEVAIRTKSVESPSENRVHNKAKESNGHPRGDQRVIRKLSRALRSSEERG